MKVEVVANFVMRLLHSRTDAQLMHWQTTSFAEHMALGDYYDDIGDLVDNYVESYQGIYGILEGFTGGYTPPGSDCLSEMEDLGNAVANMRDDLPDDSELQNIVDEIASLIDRTIYKLRFLK